MKPITCHTFECRICMAPITGRVDTLEVVTWDTAGVYYIENGDRAMFFCRACYDAAVATHMRDVDQPTPFTRSVINQHAAETAKVLRSMVRLKEEGQAPSR